jgi:MoxR-like ATPase
MNEHIFYNDGKVVSVPLISIFAASNEPPEDESLLAMHDRFLFRMEVEYVHDNANKKRMFNNYLYERAGVNISNNYTTITIDELKLLQEETKKVVVSKDIINKFISIINSLNKNSTISISDRRANECFKVLQGSAIVHNRKKVTLDDFNSLKYVLWDKKEDMDAINAEIAKIANPFDENFEKYKRQFEQIKDQFDRASNDQERNRLFYQHNNSLKSVINKFNKLINDASSNGKDIEEYAKIRDEIVQFNTELVDNAVGII